MIETAIKPEHFDQARNLAALGANDREIAELIDVSEQTRHRWKHSDDRFSGSLKLGKQAADDRVTQSLYRRATGDNFDAQKVSVHDGAPTVIRYVVHLAPDVSAAKYCLGNRRKWPCVQCET